MKVYLGIICAAALLACNSANTEVEATLSTAFTDTSAYNAAFLITDGVYNTELVAPYDIYQHTKFRKGIKPIRVFTVSNKSTPVTTFEGLKIIPDFDLKSGNVPRIDILIIPSAEHHMDSDLKDTSLVNWIARAGANAMFVTSHCDGAFILAQSGLLDKSVSTTFPADIEAYKTKFPHLSVKDSVWFVHDGKFITSAGGARSFEASLYLTELMYGDSIAISLGNGLVIDWNLDRVPHYIHQQ